MRLTALRLEGRDCPALAVGPDVWLDGGRVVRPFADAPQVAIAIAESGDEVWVGALAPGGPRVAVLDQAGDRVRPDFFAGDPAGRGGVALVPMPAIAAAPPAEDQGGEDLDGEDLALTGRSGFTVFLDFEARREWRAATAAAVFELLGGLVSITTSRPDDFPIHYGTAVFGSPLSYTAGLYPPVGAGGIAPPDWTDGRASWWDAEPVYVDDRYTLSPAAAARMIAHEAGHALGVHHADGEPWDRLDLIAKGAAAAANYTVPLSASEVSP